MSKQNPLDDCIAPYLGMIEGLVALFHPFMEAAVHDLKTGKIVALYHNISQRNVGDPSPLHELKIPTSEFPDFFAPYLKRNSDGRQLKCTSITIRDETKTPVALVCFNVDISHFQESAHLLNSFLTVAHGAENPIELFGGSCEERIESQVTAYLEKENLSLNYLSKVQKKALVQHLHTQGIFNYKNAAVVLAHTLKLSRATIYNYINQMPH